MGDLPTWVPNFNGGPSVYDLRKYQTAKDYEMKYSVGRNGTAEVRVLSETRILHLKGRILDVIQSHTFKHTYI
jgi:hypothetical protein